MVSCNELICPKCGGELKYYSTVKRIVKAEYGKAKKVNIQQYICTACGSVHRALPEYLYPYKHYRAEIINGVLNGTVTPYELEYEDYPCEMTMKRWIKEFAK